MFLESIFADFSHFIVGLDATVCKKNLVEKMFQLINMQRLFYWHFSGNRIFRLSIFMLLNFEPSFVPELCFAWFCTLSTVIFCYAFIEVLTKYFYYFTEVKNLGLNMEKHWCLQKSLFFSSNYCTWYSLFLIAID